MGSVRGQLQPPWPSPAALRLVDTLGRTAATPARTPAPEHFMEALLRLQQEAPPAGTGASGTKATAVRVAAQPPALKQSARHQVPPVRLLTAGTEPAAMGGTATSEEREATPAPTPCPQALRPQAQAEASVAIARISATVATEVRQAQPPKVDLRRLHGPPVEMAATQGGCGLMIPEEPAATHSRFRIHRRTSDHHRPARPQPRATAVLAAATAVPAATAASPWRTPPLRRAVGQRRPRRAQRAGQGARASTAERTARTAPPTRRPPRPRRTAPRLTRERAPQAQAGRRRRAPGRTSPSRGRHPRRRPRSAARRAPTQSPTAADRAKLLSIRARSPTPIPPLCPTGPTLRASSAAQVTSLARFWARATS